MNIEGKVVKILPIESGTGKTGNGWKKQPFVIEFGDKYPKQLCVTMWGDAIVTLSEGDTVKVQFDLESREFNGKYYTEVKAWKVEGNLSEKQTSSQSDSLPRNESGIGLGGKKEDDDDLPFNVGSR